MADTLQFGPEWLRNLTHGNSSHASGSGHSSISARTGVKPSVVQYSRDAMLSMYNASTSMEIPEGVQNLPEIMSDRTLQPMAWIPQSTDEVHLLTMSAKGNTASIRVELETPTRHRTKPNWTATREQDDSLSRSKHSRDDYRDDSSKNFESTRNRPSKDTQAEFPRPEFSRSMSSDNWRESKKRDLEVDASVPSWRARTEHNNSRSATRNWRDPPEERSRRGSESLHHDRGDYSRKKANYDRSYSGFSDEEETALPEWSTEDVSTFGTFNAEGIFIPTGDLKDAEDWTIGLEDEAELEGDMQDTLNPESASIQDEAAAEKLSDENGICEDNSNSAVMAGQSALDESTDVFYRVLPETAAPDTINMISNLPVATSVNADSAGESINTGVVPPDEQYIPAPVDEHGELSSVVNNESDIEFIRMGIVPENLVASLFLDDDNTVATASGASAVVCDEAVASLDAKPPTMSEPRKGFVSGDHPDALNWFYQDPQGVIQGPFRPPEMTEWFNAGYFSHNLLVKHGCDINFIQLGDLIKKVGQDPFNDRSAFLAIGRAASQVPSAVDPRPPVSVTDGTSSSATQIQLLQMQQLLMKKQQETLRQQQQQQQVTPTSSAVPLGGQQPVMSNPQQQQQQALIQMLLQSQAVHQNTANHTNVTQSMVTGAVAGSGGVVVRPRAIKSQQQPQMSVDMALQQQRDPKAELAAKLTSGLLQQGNAASAVNSLTAEQKMLLQMILKQQAMSTASQQHTPLNNANRPMQQNPSSFHRSVSQPVGIEMTGFSNASWNMPTAGGAKVQPVANSSINVNSFGASSSIAQPSSLWRGASCVPLNPMDRLTVEELEAVQLLAARQEQQKQRQAAEELEAKEQQIKAALLQQQQRRSLLQGQANAVAERERQQQLAAAVATEFDMRERQRQEELRRRQEKAEEIRRIQQQQQRDLLRSLPLQSDQSLQLALSAVNGYGANTAVEQRRDFQQTSHEHQLAALAGSNYWLSKEAGENPAKLSGANLSQWHLGSQQPTTTAAAAAGSIGGGFNLDGRSSLNIGGHAKMASESSSWEDLASALSSKNAPVNLGGGAMQGTAAQMLLLNLQQQQQQAAANTQSGSKTPKEESLQKILQAGVREDDFNRWCDAAVKSFQTGINVQVFLRNLAKLDDSAQVAQYIRSVLGNSQDALSFTQQYWDKRQQTRMLQELLRPYMPPATKW